MLTFAINLPGTEALSFGSSKVFQIITPLLTYMVLQEIPAVKNLLSKLVRLIRSIKADIDMGRWEFIFRMIIGFIAWKIGCDFGFLIVNTGSAPWSIAFTLVGLIPYGIVMYVVYYLIGQKMIIQGQLNPFKEQYVPPKFNGRPSFLKQFTSKFFHESMNATSANVPLRQVFIKPFIDYGAIIASWPFYNVVLLYSQSGEVNFAPYAQFTFLSIFVFYVVNVGGFILGYNLGEFIYFRLHEVRESFKAAAQKVQLRQKINQLWAIFDEDGDGVISEAEFRKATRILGQDPTNAELCSLMTNMDIDRSGSIDFDEFKNILLAKKDERRVKLLLGEADKHSQFKGLKQIGSMIALQWQLIKNNTFYIRLQGFLSRYGLNNRWLLSGGLGIIAIVLLEPAIAGKIFSLADQLQHAYFYQFGQLDQIHLAQVASTQQSSSLPSLEGLTMTVPDQLATLNSQQMDIPSQGVVAQK
jgi:hypothetical protein